MSSVVERIERSVTGMQVLSGGLLRATPHYVKAPRAAKTEEVSRETLAIFMQPRSIPSCCVTDTQSTYVAVFYSRHTVDVYTHYGMLAATSLDLLKNHGTVETVHCSPGNSHQPAVNAQHSLL